MNRWFAIVLIALTAGALALRLPELGRRPLHNDEGVNAFKLRDLLEKGIYKYDPHEYHGPTLSYASLPFLWLTGHRNTESISDGTLRLAPVFFGVLLVLLLWLLRDALGHAAALWAALFTAISPAMVFYSRYFIHEMLLICFTLLALAAAWRYTRSRKAVWAALAGLGLGLMYATKETFVIELAAMAVALVMTLLWSRWRENRSLQPEIRSLWNLKHVLLATTVALVASELLYTSFLTNPRGPLDSILTFLPWTKRAGGASPHNHPWYFYLQHLGFFRLGQGPIWTEGLIVALALVGVIASLLHRSLPTGHWLWLRFLGFYTVALTTAYSVISYKTPWCLLGFLHGMILMAGVGAVVVLRLVKPAWAKGMVVVILLSASAQLTWQAWRANHEFAADRRNPYVYSQTLPDTLELVNKVKFLAQLHPEGNDMVIKIMSPEHDYWPLPWYLRQFKNVGCWDQIPEEPFAPVMIVGTRLQADFEEKSGKKYIMAGLFSLRPLTFFELYVEADLWRKYVQLPPHQREPE